MRLSKDQHDAIELLKIHIITQECKNIGDVLDIFEEVLVSDEI